VLTGTLEVDGIVLLRVFRASTNPAALFFIDAHIPVCKHATKQRNKVATGSFYT
jgi:hypothetical protein